MVIIGAVLGRMAVVATLYARRTRATVVLTILRVIPLWVRTETFRKKSLNIAVTVGVRIAVGRLLVVTLCLMYDRRFV